MIVIGFRVEFDDNRLRFVVNTNNGKRLRKSGLICFFPKNFPKFKLKTFVGQISSDRISRYLLKVFKNYYHRLLFDKTQTL